VPPGLTFLYNANPLGAVIEAARAAIIGQPVPWIVWTAALALGAAAALLGHALFQHIRDEFADAL
jgi:lipopolysaccharide transport system permease protein